MRIAVLFLLIITGFALRAQERFSLADAIDYALENHNAMRVATLNGEQAYWQFREAKAIGMPQLTAKVNYTYYYKRPVVPTQDFLTPAIFGILFDENIIEPRELGEPAFFDFGFIRRNQLFFGLSADALVFDGNYLKGLKVAKKFINLAKNRAILSEQQIRQQVIRAYQNVLVAERNVSIIEQNISNITRLLTETRAMYENGFVEELDVDRLVLSLDNLNTEKEKLSSLIEVGYNVLKYEMAYPMNEAIKVTDNLEDVVNTILLEVPLGRDSAAQYERPEIFLLEEAIDLDKADLDRIRQGYVPSISANISYDQSLQRDEFFNGNESGLIESGSIGLKANIPIYDGGDTKSKLEIKKIVLSKREYELEETRRAIHLQISNALTNFDNARSALNRSVKALELNEKIYDKTNIKYREGVGSSVELTQAEASLHQSQASYINALYELLVSKTDLDIATGAILKILN
jgi:outer membrane protein TolC